MALEVLKAFYLNVHGCVQKYGEEKIVKFPFLYMFKSHVHNRARQ